MSKIKILSPEIYNLISAGEVVERPVGAVKELVENCVDACAKRIVIEVKNGGFDLISVSDNGTGIKEEDIPLAFMKHATSKISCAEEVYAVQTLGFRGEALPSIAAVSRVKMTTKYGEEESAVCVTLENGEIVSKEYVSANCGTTIEIRNLFYNTPGRLKFLKSPAREASEITKYVSKFILTNPYIQITYILDDQKIFETHGNGLEEGIFAVYGEECLSNCLQISCTRHNMLIQGYIGSPEYTKANKTCQTLSVNGRCIVDNEINGAIQQAYKPYLMTRRFPFYVLNVELPCTMVDVNVHPKKSEVRFVNHSSVCGGFYRCISEELKRFTEERVKSILGDSADTQSADDETDENKQTYKQLSFAELAHSLMQYDDLEVMNPGQADDVRAMEKSTREADKIRSLEEFADRMERENTVENARKLVGLDDDKHIKQSTLVLQHVEPEVVQPDDSHDEYDDIMERVRILGAAFKTYLILEYEDKVIVVDQHAAHERILFDKFMEGKSTDMQPMLFPYVFSVSDEESEFIENNRENILKAGIDVEPFGHNTYRISSVSTLLGDTKMSDFVQFLLSSVDEFKIDDRKLIVEKIAQKACKAAVKAGYALNEYEIKYIIKTICENREFQCPHGRPITIVFTKSQIEKLFKRIV